MDAEMLPDDRLVNFATGSNYQPMDVIGEGAYGIVWYVLTIRSCLLVIHILQ